MEIMFEYTRVFISLLVILGTFGNPFIFNTIFDELKLDLKEKRRAIKKAYTIAYIFWLFIFISGPLILYLFGITTKSFAIAGSLFLSYIGFEILVKDIPASANVGKNNENLEKLITSPIAIPLITGPGTITTTILYRALYPDVFLLFLTMSLSFLFSFLFIYIFIGLLDKINKKFLVVMGRLFGLIMIAISIEILLNALNL